MYVDILCKVAPQSAVYHLTLSTTISDSGNIKVMLIMSIVYNCLQLACTTHI